VGIADRSDFDLTQHSNHTGARMSVHVPFPDGPRLVDALEVKPDKKTIGQKYGKKANHLFEFLAGLSTDEAKSLQEKLAAGYVELQISTQNLMYLLTFAILI
jgi:glycyl-tRNA synthetase (class II)